MIGTQQFKQLQTTIGRLALVVAFLLSAKPALNSAQAAGPSSPPTPSSQEVIRGTTFCGWRIIRYRAEIRPPEGSNVACFEYKDGGQLFTLTVASPGSKKGSEAIFVYHDRAGYLIKTVRVSEIKFDGSMVTVQNKHSEMLAHMQLQHDGIDRNSVIQIESERKPCVVPSGCLTRVIPKYPNAVVHHHVQYSDADSRKQGNEDLKQERQRDRYRNPIGASLGRKLAKEDLARGTVPLFTPPARQGTSDKVVSPTGALPESLSGSKSNGAAKSASGGIDFSTLELRYLSENSGSFADRSLRYAFNGIPAAHNKNLNAGRTAAAQASDAFFVWLSLPSNKFWVNLNPDEPDRIIDPQLGKTDAGRILLQADLRMKKTVAQLIHPDTSLGKQFWQQLDRDGSRSCLSFRQWIVPAPAIIREDGDGIYIADAPLNVKLESQYFKAKGLSGFLSSCSIQNKSIKEHNESVFRRLILPRIEQAVNTAPEYAELRRVYRSRVAAEWYRQRSTSQATNYREMVNQGDISSWPARQDWSSRQVFDQYVDSFTKGEFHVVHSHKWQESNMIYTQKRLYLYGGVDFTKVLFNKLSSTDFQEKWGDLQQVVDNSLKAPVADHHGKIWLGGSTTTGKAIWKSIWFYLALGALVITFLIYRTRTHRKRWL
jgi:hypothetical protein